jgi:hypothetical protein
VQLRDTSLSNLRVPIVVNLRCPVCGRHGTFDTYNSDRGDLMLHAQADGSATAVITGERRCPAPDCRAHLFFVADNTPRKNLLATYPAERLEFNPAGVPHAVSQALVEAITCHADDCYVAAAIMVRKAIEELCNHQGATGVTLHDRVEALGQKVVLPAPFLAALHDLRLLGNDAAHIEARTFNDVGEAEVRAGIAVARRLLEATYQYDAVMGELAALKRQPTGGAENAQ